jgi:hypothetical protein
VALHDLGHHVDVEVRPLPRHSHGGGERGAARDWGLVAWG